MIVFFLIQVYPFQIVKLHEFRVNQQVYRSGETIDYVLNFTKYFNIKPKIEYYLIDHSITKLTQGGVNRPQGKQKHILSLQLPNNVASDSYHIQIDLTYKVLGIRDVTYSWQSNDFEVVGK